MEILITALAAIVLFGILAAVFGTDSRPVEDDAWWPGSRGDMDYPGHRA